MQQLNNIQRFKNIVPHVKGIDAAILYGSFGRKEGKPNSDMDIQLVLKEGFEKKTFIEALKTEFNIEILSIREVELRNKIVVYFSNCPKLEFWLCNNITEIERNYLGSEIFNIEDTLLYVNENSSEHILNYLRNIIAHKIDRIEYNNQYKYIDYLIEKFIYEFESCSNMHKRSDAYQFYFFYNIALHIAVQLNYISKGKSKFNFLPKNFITDNLDKEEQNDFYNLNGTLFLPKANQQKRKLLDFFYASIFNLLEENKFCDIQTFCESIYNRDFLWNFRDISLFNSKIKKGIIYRTSSLTLINDETIFNNLIKNKNIKTVVDLRADREIEESNYDENRLQQISWIHAPFDPWNQSIEFQTNYNHGSNIEIAYRFFMMECKESIKIAMLNIIKGKDSIAIHCHAGKDRTGIVISLLHLLSAASDETIYNDYLATEMDTKKEYLGIALEFIQNEGGIVPYLKNCGLTENHISQLKNKILNEH